MKSLIKVTDIPARYRMVLVFLVPVLTIAAAYFLVFGAQLREKRRLEGIVRTERQEIAGMAAMKGGMAKAKTAVADLKEELQTRLKQMPEQQEVPDLLRQVSLDAQETRTHVKYFAPKQPKPGDFYWELPFEMRYTALYHSVGYFFDGIRKLERIVDVTGFSLEAKGTGRRTMLEGTCLGKTYVFMKTPPPPPPKGNQKKGAAPAPKKEIAAAVFPIPADFAYTSKDRRDPFEALYVERTAKKKTSVSPKKEGYDLDELKLVGIVRSGGERTAMMEDVQGRGLLFKKGDFLNKNLWVLETLDNRVILAYKLKGDIHTISLDIPKK